jgi:transposase-like protein
MAAEARRLRVEEQLSVRQIQQRLGVGKDRVHDWLRGIPVPDWTRRPNAKDDLRARAIELREQGASVNAIAAELGVSKSTAYLWTRLTWVGSLNERELAIAGALVYWSEGAKAKPWRDQYDLDFINSDPMLVELFLRFLEAQGFPRDQLKYRVSIHESADADAATRWWADRIGVSTGRMQRPTLKRHSPRTKRRNVGEDYHGCVTVNVPRSRELYWWIEGVVAGVAGATSRISPRPPGVG